MSRTLVYVLGFIITMFVVLYFLYKAAPEEKYPPASELDDGSGYNIIGVISVVTIAATLWPITLIVLIAAALLDRAAHFKSRKEKHNGIHE